MDFQICLSFLSPLLFPFFSFHCFSNEFFRYFVLFFTFYYPSILELIIGLFVINPCHGYIFPTYFELLGNVLI